MRRSTHVHRALSVLAVALLALAMVQFSGGSASGLSTQGFAHDDDDLVGLDTAVQPSNRPAVEAAFRLEGYRSGETARLRFFSSANDVTLAIVHAGTETFRLVRNDVMAGQAVRPDRPIEHVPAAR